MKLGTKLILFSLHKCCGTVCIYVTLVRLWNNIEEKKQDLFYCIDKIYRLQYSVSFSGDISRELTMSLLCNLNVLSILCKITKVVCSLF